MAVADKGWVPGPLGGLNPKMIEVVHAIAVAHNDHILIESRFGNGDGIHDSEFGLEESESESESRGKGERGREGEEGHIIILFRGEEIRKTTKSRSFVDGG